jgi:hypothetical protein
MLVFFIIIGLKWLNPEVANANLDSSTAFSREKSPSLPYSYAEALCS